MTNPVELCWQIYEAMGREEKERFGAMVAAKHMAMMFSGTKTGTKAGVAPGAAKVRAGFAEFSRAYYVKRITNVDYSKDSAYAVEGEFLKPRMDVDEGELLFFGFKKPMVGFALLAVELGEKASIEADTGEVAMLHDVRVVAQAKDFATIKKALTEYFAPF